jgi:uncharacterized delta-60 repeat protein
MTDYNGTPVNGIVRLDQWWNIDPTFNVWGSGFTLIGTPNIWYDYYIQPDDKILIVGNFSHYNGTPANGIIRLNANGSIDGSFIYWGWFNGYAEKIKPLPGGWFIIMWSFSTYNWQTAQKFAKLSSTWVLDTAFMSNMPALWWTLYDVEIQSNGKLILWWAAYFMRLNTNGTLDTTFNVWWAGFVYNASPSFTPSVYWPTNPTVHDMAVLPDDSIVVWGWLASYNWSVTNNIAKINADGTLNSTFQTNVGVWFNWFTMWVTYDPYNDRLLIGWWFNQFNWQPAFSFVILNSNGSIYAWFPLSGFNDYAPNGTIIDSSTFIVQGNFNSFQWSGTMPWVAVFGPWCVPDTPCLPTLPVSCDLNDPLLAGICYYPGADNTSIFYVKSAGGQVWINNDSPTEELDINWTLRSVTQSPYSDARLKSSIEKIDNALEKIRQIHWVEFIWKKSGNPDMWVLAQEIEKVFKEAVETDENGMKAVQYTALLAPVIEAIHELHTNIDTLANEKFEAQNKRIDTIEQKILQKVGK